MAEGTVGIQYSTWGDFVVEMTSAVGMTNNEVTSAVFRFPFRVIDFWAIMTAAGGAADTGTLKAVATDGTTERTISDALDLNKSDKVVTRMGTLDDATADIAAGEKLRVETASDAVARFYIRCVRI